MNIQENSLELTAAHSYERVHTHLQTHDHRYTQGHVNRLMNTHENIQVHTHVHTKKLNLRIHEQTQVYRRTLTHTNSQHEVTWENQTLTHKKN
jgi:hypothetical protein